MEIKPRCPWLDVTKADYVAYHDNEWGVPVFDDQTLFECLTLECSQAGLSWYTILKRRSGYREAFCNFDIQKVAAFTEQDTERLVLDARIIRHKGKIAATINNAQCVLAIQESLGSFSDYLWGFVENHAQVYKRETLNDYPATSDLSDMLSKDLKKRGFKFVGSTTMYAFLQAIGIINDHSENCFKKPIINNTYINQKIKFKCCN